MALEQGEAARAQCVAERDALFQVGVRGRVRVRVRVRVTVTVTVRVRVRVRVS